MHHAAACIPEAGTTHRAAASTSIQASWTPNLTNLPDTALICAFCMVCRYKLAPHVVLPHVPCPPPPHLMRDSTSVAMDMVHAAHARSMRPMRPMSARRT